MKEDKRLKKQGVVKKERPAQPERDRAYPTKTQLALQLLQAFKAAHGGVKINAVLADALYGEGTFMDQASQICGGRSGDQSVAREPEHGAEILGGSWMKRWC